MLPILSRYVNTFDSMNRYFITTFYCFKSLSSTQIDEIKCLLNEFGKPKGMLGLMILGNEGINATVCAPSPEILTGFKELIMKIFELTLADFKDSSTDSKPFKRFKVDLRDEIVTIGRTDLVPSNRNHRHLTPTNWDKEVQSPNTIVLDTRNLYETKLGTFKNAILPPIGKFTELSDFVKKQDWNKNQKILMFCTGGIRCEKAILELEDQGFNNVYQLQGGILKYLEEFPNSQYVGECFVFDDRVAVDQNLKPSTRFGLCPHCGKPSDHKIECIRCHSAGIVCEDCFPTHDKKTCSKTCAHFVRTHTKVK